MGNEKDIRYTIYDLRFRFTVGISGLRGTGKTVLLRQLANELDPECLTGALREEFFIHHILGANLTVNYLKGLRGQKLPDYLVFHKGKKIIFEIGGAGKGAAQFKGVEEREKYLLTQPGVPERIPLILMGFLW